MNDISHEALPSDWPNLTDLFADMRRFAQENPAHIFLCADDPGFNHEPPRVHRLGWVAYLPGNPEDEKLKQWTITFANVTSEGLDPKLVEKLHTPKGRVLLIEDVIGRQNPLEPVR